MPRTDARRSLAPEDLAFLSLVGWCGYVDPTWRAFPHLVLLCRALEELAFAVARGETRKLMVFMPPQHGKSSITSKAFTSWVIGRWPTVRVILASYEASYAALWGRRARDVMTEHGQKVFGVRVRQDSHAADHWELARPHQGVLHTTGSTGGTGHPAEIVVIDDPVKGREEAESVTIREKTIEWYKGSIRTRRPKGQVVVQTRWNTGDLSGWILDNEPGEWRVIRLPALAEADDPVGRPVGAPLCPELQSLESLLSERKIQGSYCWASVYEQRPTPLGGSLFKREHAVSYDLGPDGFYRWGSEVANRRGLTRFQTVDTATSEDEQNDYTAVATWGLTETDLLLLDLDMRRIEGPAICEAVCEANAKWDCIAWIEENSTSKHLLSFLSSQNVPFRVLAPQSKAKVVRALPASALWEQGKVVLPRDAEWLAEAERQLYAFPSGKHDDFVDTLAWAAIVALGELWGSALPNVAPPRPVAHGFEGAQLRAPPGWR